MSTSTLIDTAGRLPRFDDVERPVVHASAISPDQFNSILIVVVLSTPFDDNMARARQVGGAVHTGFIRP